MNQKKRKEKVYQGCGWASLKAMQWNSIQLEVLGHSGTSDEVRMRTSRNLVHKWI